MAKWLACMSCTLPDWGLEAHQDPLRLTTLVHIEYRYPMTVCSGFLSLQHQICAQLIPTIVPVTTTVPLVHQQMEDSVATVTMATLILSTVTGRALVRVYHSLDCSCA